MPPESGVRRSRNNGAAATRAVIYGKYGGWLRGVFVQRFGPAHLDGLRIGRSDAVLVRLLHLFTIDYAGMPWFRRGEPPPPVRLPAHIRVRWLPADEWRQNPGLLARPADVVAARFESGARCLIAWDETAGRTAYHLWVTEGGAYVDWIFRYIAAPPGHLMVFDAWVHPEYRGGNMHWAGASECFAEAARRGRLPIFAGMEELEYFPFVEKIARLGLGISVPHSKLTGLKLFSMTWHFTGGPSPLLAAFGVRLRAMYQDRNGRDVRLKSAAR